jgi:Glycosyl hydrolase family 26
VAVCSTAARAHAVPSRMRRPAVSYRVASYHWSLGTSQAPKFGTSTPRFSHGTSQLGMSRSDWRLARIADGTWDTYLRQYASEVKAWGHPFFLRFAGEMNGSWVSWFEGNSGNSAGQFVQAWRHVHNIFTSVGATNATWVWCPNTENAYTTPLEDLYPGKAYVDWAGIDGYNFSIDLAGTPWRSFSTIFSQTYHHILRLIPPTMPVMIGEMGSVEDGGSKAAWITDALSTQLPKNYPRIKALVWFEQSDGNLNLRFDTSPSSLAAFQKAIAATTYQANNYSTLDQSPIPAPEQVVFPSPPTSPPPPTPTPMVILLALLVSLAFIVLIVLIVLFRKRGTEETQTTKDRAS